jgi:hypothetical protein
MNEQEANTLANHIAIWSVEHDKGYNPHIQQIGNGTWVVILYGKGHWHVWTFEEWYRDFEPLGVQEVI